MNDLYFEINPKKNYITSQPKQLEHNWKNISGFIYLSEEQKYDLSWAGYENIGFIKITEDNGEKLQNFKSLFNVSESLKTIMRKDLSQNRYEKETGIIVLNNEYRIQLTEECKLSLVMKYIECLNNPDLVFSWKFINGYYDFTTSKFKKFYDEVQKYTQKLFDIEKNILEDINSKNNIKDLLSMDLNINCDENIRL